MTIEINPVLAGTYDAQNYAPSNNFAAPAATEDASGVDTRLYTKFDRSAAEAGSTTDFSFSDLVDAINPLQHIPIVSSLYRAATGDTINPISRVAGDILYGGALGPASAILGGIGAVADAGLEAQTGKDSAGIVVASLFGPGTAPAATQIADAGNTASSSPAPTSNAAPVVAPAPTVSAVQLASNDAVPADPGGIPLASPKSYPLKQPYGGVMAPVSDGPINAVSTTNGSAEAVSPATIKAQDLAMALSEGAPGIRLGHTIYTNQLANGPHALPPMLSSGMGTPQAATTQVSAPVPAAVVAPPPVVPAIAPLPTINSASASPSPFDGIGGLSLPQNGLSPDLGQNMMLRALSQYKSVAGGQSTGGLVNLTN